MFVPTDASGPGDPGAGAGALSARARRRPGGGVAMRHRRRRSGAPSRARCRGGVPPLSLQRPPRGPLLAGRRRPQHARPLAVRPAERTGIRQGRRRQMDRRGDGRSWRSARHHPRKLRPRRLPRRRRRGAALSQPAATGADRQTMRDASSSAPAGSPESARRLFAMSQPISGTIVEAYLRQRGITALHGTGSLRFHPRCYYRPDEDVADRDLAGDDRRRHRSRRR